MQAQQSETRIAHWGSKTIIFKLFLEAMSLVKPHVPRPRRAHVSGSEGVLPKQVGTVMRKGHLICDGTDFVLNHFLDHAWVLREKGSVRPHAISQAICRRTIGDRRV
jgi:hypothetical protein